MDELIVVFKVLVLLGIANGTPIIAKKIFGRRFARPLDGGTRAHDGRPWLGPAKTVRGLVLSVLVTTLAVPLLGYAPAVGAALAATSMFGDLLSSFIKRRLALKPHSQALGLDQIPESALPLLVLHQQLGITLQQGIVIVALFFILELWLSRLLYQWHLRDRPY